MKIEELDGIEHELVVVALRDQTLRGLNEYGAARRPT